MQTGLAIAQDDTAPPPPGEQSCSVCGEPDLTQEYIDYCNENCNTPLPADDSIHILMAVGLVFGTFVIFKKINHKKTPI